MVGQGSLAYQAGHGGEVVEHISQEEDGRDAGETVNGHAFEAPGFEGGVASFDGISSAVVVPFPGWRANGDISGQTNGAIGKTGTQVDDPAMVSFQVRAVWGRIGHIRELELGCCVFQASLLAKPFGTLASTVKAIENQAVAVGADRSAAIVISPQNPVFLIFIGWMTAQVDHPAGLQVVVDGMQKNIIAIPGIASHGVNFQVRIVLCQLE